MFSFWFVAIFVYLAGAMAFAQVVLHLSSSSYSQEFKSNRVLVSGAALSLLGLTMVWPLSMALMIYVRRWLTAEERHSLQLPLPPVCDAAVAAADGPLDFTCHRCAGSFKAWWPSQIMAIPHGEKELELGRLRKSWVLCYPCASVLLEEVRAPSAPEDGPPRA